MDEAKTLPPEERDVYWAVNAVRCGAMVRLPKWGDSYEHWKLADDGRTVEWSGHGKVVLAVFSAEIGFELYEPEPEPELEPEPEHMGSETAEQRRAAEFHALSERIAMLSERVDQLEHRANERIGELSELANMHNGARLHNERTMMHRIRVLEDRTAGNEIVGGRPLGTGRPLSASCPVVLSGVDQSKL